MASVRKRKGRYGVSYYVQVRVKGHKQVTKTFKRKSDAERWAEDTEALIRSGTDLDGISLDDLLFTKALDRYLVEVSSKKAYNSRRREEDAAKQLVPYFKQYTLKEITPALVAQYRDFRLQKVSASTIHKELALLSHLFRIAEREWSMDVENPVSRISKPTLPRGRLRILDKDESERLLNEAKKSRNKKLYPYLILQLYTGMRPSEGAGLRWEQVFLDQKVIDLTRTKTEPRRVPLTTTATEILESIKPAEQTGWVFLPANPSQRIIGRPNLFFRRSFDTAVKRAKIDDFNMHDLRHTAASYLLMAGADIRTLADILGHKTMDMVYRYTHLLDDHKLATVEKIDGLY